MQPVLLIGLGRTGAHVVAGALAKLLEGPSTTKKVGYPFQFVCTDTDTHCWKPTGDGEESSLNRLRGTMCIQWIRRLIWLLSLFLLAGCGLNIDVDQEMTFYPDEAWEMRVDLMVPVQTLAFSGARVQIEQTLDEAVQAIEVRGGAASWESTQEEQGLRYSMEASGEGYELLREISFFDVDIEAQVVDGQRQIAFGSCLSSGLIGGTHTLTLIGGDVISTDGVEIEKGKVQWMNPGECIEAVMTEKRRVPLGLMLPAGVLLVGIVVGGWALSRRRRPTRCGNCDSELSPQAKFCPYCGHER